MPIVKDMNTYNYFLVHGKYIIIVNECLVMKSYIALHHLKIPLKFMEIAENLQTCMCTNNIKNC